MLSNNQKNNNILFCFNLIPLCLSIGTFGFIILNIIIYNEERYNDKIYLNSQCYLNGTIIISEPCKDDICWWIILSHLCPTTFRICLKSIYIINYGNNQKAFTDKQPKWIVSLIN
jgi:hypothetical protein